jgi:hypothetical protein
MDTDRTHRQVIGVIAADARGPRAGSGASIDNEAVAASSAVASAVATAVASSMATTATSVVAPASTVASTIAPTSTAAVLIVAIDWGHQGQADQKR